MNAEAAAPAPVAMVGHGRFIGESRQYFRLLSRDAVMLIVTLGLYRFWVASDIRRYLWSNTEIAGDELEYTGDPRELFVGFMVIVVVLCPLFAASSVAAKVAAAAWAPFLFSLVNSAALALFAVLAVLALYQARRYRLCHTIFRGLRFRQRGSAWIYALLTAVWFIVNLLTLGLSYPFARKSLERYKMRHIYYGDLQGDFQARAGQLFKTGFLLWLVVFGPAAAIVIANTSKAASEGEISQAIGYGFEWITFAALAVYPAFHANALRWRIAGMRFGTLRMEAPFSTWALYKAYLRFLALMVPFVIVVARVSDLFQHELVPSLPEEPSKALALLMIVITVLGYFVIITVITFAYQATVRFTLWRLIVNALMLTGVEALDAAKAQPGWLPHHEGRIGSALSIGGF